MTADEWASCREPQQMLAFLRDRPRGWKARLLGWLRRGQPARRKLVLFGCACCRRLTLDAASVAAVGAAERFADGLAPLEEMRRATAAGHPQIHVNLLDVTQPSWTPSGLARWAAWRTRVEAAAKARSRKAGKAAGAKEREKQCHLLRDLFGPLALPPGRAVDPAWLAADGGLLRRLAEAAYQQRCPAGGTLDGGRLAVLADALEETGCAAGELLCHLREPRAHVRGCWAVDAVLGLG